MVTGSHNPPQYNGLKMMIGGDTLFGDRITALYRRLEEADLLSGQGSHREMDIGDEYLQRILGDITLSKKMRVGIDCGNGVAGVMAPDLFRRLGCEVVEFFCDVDGTFPNHHPDPSKPENMRDLIAAVVNQQLDIGLAFDGDGDRVGVIDNAGNLIWPDRQLILFAEDVISRNPGARIIYDVKCSRLLPQAIKNAGGVPEMWKTGHSFVKARLKETGALLGGEMSGHVFFKERWYGFDDALYAGARLLEILSARDETAHDIFSAIPDSINTPELNVEFAEGEHHKFIQRFVAAASFEGAQLTTIDGVRADYDDGWGLVRASNTTPVLVIRFEADTQAALERIQTVFRTEMLKLDADLSLPF
jgi:phosphomannomutase/phosphoglucomutase